MAEGKITIGMTRKELDRVMGMQPTKVNGSLYKSGRQDQLIYEQSTRTLYVYTENDVVTTVQESQRSAPPSTSAENNQAVGKPCPTSRDIWNLEVEKSKLENRGNDRLQAELTRQIGEARNCGR